MFDNFRNNWKIVKGDPRKWADFNLKVVKIVLGVLAVLIIWQFGKVIIGFNTGSSTMNMVGRLLAFLFMCMILYSGYNRGYLPLRARLLHEVNVPNPQPIKQYTNPELDTLIDETVNDFDNKFKKGVENNGNKK